MRRTVKVGRGVGKREIFRGDFPRRGCGSETNPSERVVSKLAPTVGSTAKASKMTEAMSPRPVFWMIPRPRNGDEGMDSEVLNALTAVPAGG